VLGPPNRDGYTNVPNAEAERLFNDLTVEQFRLYVGLRIEAQHTRPAERRDKFGRPFTLDVGEAVISVESLAERYAIRDHRGRRVALTKDQVRRALARFEQLGLAALRAATGPRAKAASPDHSATATAGGIEAATGPTVIRFTTDREKCWNLAEAATGSGPETTTPVTSAPAPPGAPIQPGNPATQEPATQEAAPAVAAAAAAAGELIKKLRAMARRRCDEEHRQLSWSRQGKASDVARLAAEIERHGGLEIVVQHCEMREGESDVGDGVGFDPIYSLGGWASYLEAQEVFGSPGGSSHAESEAATITKRARGDGRRFLKTCKRCGELFEAPGFGTPSSPCAAGTCTPKHAHANGATP
jgi:hypothetical protein